MTAGLPERLHAGARVPAMNLPQAMRLRRMALHDGRLPRYLLAPEVAALFSYIHDLQRASLVNLMWNTGARINEALALTPADFVLDDGGQPYVVLKTLKQRTRGRGRPRKEENQVPERIVPVTDRRFLEQLRQHMATFLPKRNDPLWPVTDRTVRRWLNEAVAMAARDGVTFPLTVCPKALRHSFAMHLFYSHTHKKVVQALMGHKKEETTDFYLQVFALDVAADNLVQFTWEAGDARQLLLDASCNG
ncbi:tyrosine-type recombinase/integrase [Pantoea endophytica]|uniref:tyrosine-type recombinase/integrase n=1 Tax=Pantoea endophytica TaxID=92488 RepID=UPI002413894F|nr:tyrosine-type recombinase/integrase [Pantoea endophytica]